MLERMGWVVLVILVCSTSKSFIYVRMVAMSRGAITEISLVEHSSPRLHTPLSPSIQIKEIYSFDSDFL